MPGVDNMKKKKKHHQRNVLTVGNITSEYNCFTIIV
jgi:hypothetical protein